MSITSISGRKFYNGVAITATTTYAYNASSATTATAGIRQSRADVVNLQFCVATLTATNLYIRVEGRTAGIDRWASVYVEDITAVNTLDKVIEISERFTELRMGAKVNNNATPNVLYAGLLLTDYK